MTNVLYRWGELNIGQVNLIIETYMIFLKNRGIETSRDRIYRLLTFISPDVLFEYKNGIIKAFELDSDSLCLMRELSQPSNNA